LQKAAVGVAAGRDVESGRGNAEAEEGNGVGFAFELLATLGTGVRMKTTEGGRGVGGRERAGANLQNEHWRLNGEGGRWQRVAYADRSEAIAARAHAACHASHCKRRGN
jgi:hypothetical protein